MTDTELLDIVDENDQVVGQDTKANKFEKELISRNVAIFLMDNEGNLLITKRASHKKSFPNRYDLAACGNVGAGESYEDAAKRELLEECGVECEVMMLNKLFNQASENGKLRQYFTGIFLGKHSGDVALNAELTELKKMSVKEVITNIEANRELFCPFFIKDFEFVKDKLMP